MRLVLLIGFMSLSGCLGTDKLLHAGAGAITGVVADETVGHGCKAAIAIGVAKELIDPVFSIPDVIATSLYCLKELKG